MEEFQLSKKCYNILPASPTQTFRRLFCDQVFNLILKQTSFHGRQKYEKADINWTDTIKVELKQFLAINIIMRYCRNPSIDFYWSSGKSSRNEKVATSMS